MSFSGAPTLPKLKALGSYAGASALTGAPALRKLSCAGAFLAADVFIGSPATERLAFSGDLVIPAFLSGAATLRSLGCVSLFVDLDTGLPVSIRSYTGPPRASGGMILEFDGPANRGVAWSITAGSGAISPIPDMPFEYTDKYGRAFARYDAGGYSGPLAVEVQYGAA